MAFIKKEWKNRLVEFAGRRKLTRVAGSIDNQIVVDVTREEGTVSQQGDAFSEENMNDLEQRIEDGFNDAIDKDNILDKEEVEANTEAGKHVADALVVKDLIDSLGGLTFSVVNGKPYVKVGADAARPFSGDLENLVTQAVSTTVSLSNSQTKTYNFVFNNLKKAIGVYNISVNNTNLCNRSFAFDENSISVTFTNDATSSSQSDTVTITAIGIKN